MTRRLAFIGPTTLALVLAPALRAQTLVLKTAFAGPVERCVAAPPPPRPAPGADVEGRRVASTGYEAELAGDLAAARDAFQRATPLLPDDERLAYHLGRSHEALGDPGAATRAYCRVLAIAPDGPNATDARARLESLLAAASATIAAAPETRANPVDARFAGAVAAARQRYYGQAEEAFSRLVREAPQLPEAWYDRALIRRAMGRRLQAARDLRRYLALRPNASDAPTVRAEIARLTRPAWSPALAAGMGLIIPGSGQIYTGRYIEGLAVLLFAGSATYWAFDSHAKAEVLQVPAPGGGTTRQLRVHFERPYMAQGLGLAVGSTIIASLEAHRYASRRGPNRPYAIAVGPGPTGRGLAVGVTLRR